MHTPPPHELPQRPQFAGSVRTSASQPLAAERSQSAKPASQTKLQLPPTHTGEELGRSAQTVPQPPQLDGSFIVSTHEPEQSVRPEAQLATHAPPLHT